jgi:hypothetical protein
VIIDKVTRQKLLWEYSVGPARGFIPYRYDSSIVNEEMFRGDDARPCLRAAFGEGAEQSDRFFRTVFGYCAGSPEWQGVTRGLHSFQFQLNLSSSVHRVVHVIAQLGQLRDTVLS